jgi:hypothetical protein
MSVWPSWLTYKRVVVHVVTTPLTMPMQSGRLEVWWHHKNSDNLYKISFGKFAKCQSHKIQIGRRSCIHRFYSEPVMHQRNIKKAYLLGAQVAIHNTIETLTTHTPYTVIIVAVVITPLFLNAPQFYPKKTQRTCIPAITRITRHNVVFGLYIIPSPPFPHCLQWGLCYNRSRSHSWTRVWNCQSCGSSPVDSATIRHGTCLWHGSLYREWNRCG